MSNIQRLKEAPNTSWTSLIGSSPGRMLTGRQSHINQKSKEVLFYKLSSSNFWRLINLTKICYWTMQKSGICCSFAIFLNALCSKIYWFGTLSNMYAHGPLRSIGKKEQLFYDITLNSKKRNDTSILSKWNSTSAIHNFIPCTQ